MNGEHLRPLRSLVEPVAVVLLTYIGEPLLGGIPSILIPLAYIGTVAVRRGTLAGVIAGMLCGLLLDFGGNSAIGVNLGSLALVGFAVGRINRQIVLWPLPVRAAAAALAAFLYVPAAAALGTLAGISPAWTLKSALILTTGNIPCVMILTILFRRRETRELPTR